MAEETAGIDSICFVSKRPLFGKQESGYLNNRQAHDSSAATKALLEAFSFPASPASRATHSKSASAQHKPLTPPMVLRSAARRDSPMRYSNSQPPMRRSNRVGPVMGPARSPKRQLSRRTSTEEEEEDEVKEEEQQQGDVSDLSDADAAGILLSMSAATGKSAHWQQQQPSKQPPQSPQRKQQHRRKMFEAAATPQDGHADSQLIERVAAAAQAAAAALLAISHHSPAALIAACHKLSHHCFAQQGVLDSAEAAEGILMLAQDPTAISMPTQADAGAALSAALPATELTAPAPIAGNSSSSCSRDGLAPHHRLAQQQHQQSQGLQRTSTAAANDAAGADDTAQQIVSLWTQQQSAQLPAIKTTSGRACEVPFVSALQCVFPPSPGTLHQAASPDAAALDWSAEGSFPVPAAASLLSGPFLQQQQCQHIATASPGTMAPPISSPCSALLNEDSVFAREALSKITHSTREAICAHRVAVACGTPGNKGTLHGIVVLNATGKPAIWMPKSSAAASALSALVAAGGGGWEVPGGFTEVEPRVFEDLAGKARTHNYQLSIYLTAFFCQPTPKNPWPPVRLGHFVRIVGIFTGKQ